MDDGFDEVSHSVPPCRRDHDDGDASRGVAHGRQAVRSRHACDAGLLRDDVTELLAAGRLRQPIRGVSSTPRSATTSPLERPAWRRLPDGAAVCRLTAAWLLGVDALSPQHRVDPPLVECVVPRGRQPVRRPGVRSYAASLHQDVIELSGVPTTSPRRTAIDVLRWLPPHVGLGASDALAARGLISRKEILVGLEEFSGCRGVARARYLADLIEPKTESFGESCLRLRIVDAGFPGRRRRSRSST